MSSSPSNSKTFLVTGANVGLGLDATRQLALRSDVKKVYMACRSEVKANAAIEKLVSKSNVSRDKLEFVLFDGSSSKAEIEAAMSAALPAGTVLDGVILNAGGVGPDTKGKPSEPNNILPIIQINLAAHVHLINYFVNQGILMKNDSNDSKKSRIVFAGTEAARGIKIMSFKAPKFKDSTPAYFKTYLDGSIYKKGKYDPLGAAYADAKGLSTLYMSAWARAHPEVFVMTVSPGGTKGTDFIKQDSVPAVMTFMFPIVMKVLGRFGVFHNLDVGAKRYVDAVTGEGAFEDAAFAKSGDFIASKRDSPSGPMIEQTKQFKHGKQYANIKKQDARYAALNEFL